MPVLASRLVFTFAQIEDSFSNLHDNYGAFYSPTEQVGFW